MSETYTDEQLAAMAAKSGDTIEHMKQMLNLQDPNAQNTPAGQDQNDQGGQDKNDLLAGKYKSQEDLDKGFQALVDMVGKEEAYKLLESARNKKPEDTPAADAKPADAKPAEQDALSDPKPGDKPADANQDAQPKVDFEAMKREFAETGALSEDSLKALNGMGLPKEIVDQYIEGVKAISSRFVDSVLNAAGGQDQYNAMIDWAKDNLNPAEQARFDAALDSGDSTTVMPMLEALKARYTKANGSFKRGGLDASASGTPAAGAYASQAEYLAALKDPRYKAGDPAYHTEVMAKLKNSKFV